MYYRVLEALLLAEEKRTGRSDLSAVLSNEPFHKALIALSFEIVIASCRMVRSQAIPQYPSVHHT